MQEPLFLADRTVLTSAREFLSLFGETAAREAAERADRSRDIGNVIHFCRWRQVERLVGMMDGEAGPGTIH